VKKYIPTGKKRGRPRLIDVAAENNHKLESFYRRKPIQSDAGMPL
jgi:hypothetical protein